MGTKASLLLIALLCAGAFKVRAYAVEVAKTPNPVVVSDARKNLLTTLGSAFVSPDWNQGNLLNSTAYGTLLALSIDASAAFGKPIVLDPDSTLQGPSTVNEYITGLNQRNYLENWQKPFYAL
ncbi:MAG: hypothetical protein LBB40_00530, partial [Holophagales bacterium]|nr:hypothetical protein [Holophagales bacterium]